MAQTLGMAVLSNQPRSRRTVWGDQLPVDPGNKITPRKSAGSKQTVASARDGGRPHLHHMPNGRRCLLGEATPNALLARPDEVGNGELSER